MMRSLYSGVTALRNHQTRMDVIGNNIANVNTLGFKKSRVTFQDVLNQTVRGASAPQEGRGGTNPMQVGLGMNVATIETVHTGSNPQGTGKNTDLAIQGDGFFILDNGLGGEVYTRAGAFDFDAVGNLINTSNGMLVQGYMFNESEERDTVLTGISLAEKKLMLPAATDRASIGGNLDSTKTYGEVHTIEFQVFDSLGNSHPVKLDFYKTTSEGEDADPETVWTVAASNGHSITMEDEEGADPDAGNVVLRFDLNGRPDIASIQLTLAGIAIPALDEDGEMGEEDLTVNIDLSNLRQTAGESTAVVTERNGYRAGELQALNVDATGTVTGSYSNGKNMRLAQVAIAAFNNPSSLTKLGDNLYSVSNATGEANIGTANSGGRGSIIPGALEMSNVDLAQEFTDMIVTQRGFQANNRIITVSDTMIEELVNLKR
ncbi:flagellar hook protein FlgE [Heliorestis convoluta]|uniref:Flagellar hook protein FlgE n=1 Tax=Heliorestis convoluta TaxID=356322 RepID=A0A5Q2N3K8_9FIRM|nr:flagellar hook protein FlgE [Heliorestis convoluta]QGG48176.1 flagellar hook protein FlgE [Heliorestis convoluta]